MNMKQIEEYVEKLEILIPSVLKTEEKNSQKFLDLLDRLNKLSILW